MNNSQLPPLCIIFIYVHGIRLKAEGRFYTTHKSFKTAGAVCLLGVHAKNWILSQIIQHDNMLLIRTCTPHTAHLFCCTMTVRGLFCILCVCILDMFDIIIIDRTVLPQFIAISAIISRY